MRIMHIISMPASGGAEVFVRDLAIQMRADHQDVFVVFLETASEAGRDDSFSDAFLAALDEAGIQYGFLGRKCRRNPIAGVRGIRGFAKMWKPDVIHAHLYYGAVFAAFTTVPLVYTHHSVKLKVSRWLYLLFLDLRVSAYVGICAACLGLLRNASRGRVIQIDNAVSRSRVQVRQQASRPGARPVVIAVGRLVPEKNYPMLLRAVAMLPDLDFVLRIVGEGDGRDELHQLSGALGVDDKVEFVGASTQVSRLLAESDLFVMTSVWEGLPIALLEATLAGLPVLVTNVGGCPEVVRNIGNGIVVDSLEPSAFATQLRHLLRSSELRERYAQSARENSSKYSLETATRRHLALYAEIIGSPEAA